MPAAPLCQLARSPDARSAAGSASPTAIAQRRRRTRPLLRRPAGAAGVLVPVEVPRHVAVQLPEPVLDPVVPGVRARRLPPRGGCGAVMEAMARVAGGWASQIRLDEPITEILFEGRRAVGVRTDAASTAADALVINADFAKAMTSLVPDRLRRRWTDRKLAKKRSPARPS